MKENILAEGWAIIYGPESSNPGYVELDYFRMKDFRRPTISNKDVRVPGGPITSEEWCKMYRPGCKFVRVQVMEKN